jgi:hypothetical protein
MIQQNVELKKINYDNSNSNNNKSNNKNNINYNISIDSNNYINSNSNRNSNNDKNRNDNNNNEIKSKINSNSNININNDNNNDNNNDSNNNINNDNNNSAIVINKEEGNQKIESDCISNRGLFKKEIIKSNLNLLPVHENKNNLYSEEINSNIKFTLSKLNEYKNKIIFNFFFRLFSKKNQKILRISELFDFY